MIDEATAKALEDCGTCLFSIRDTAIIVGMPYYEMKKEMQNVQGEVYLAYMRGKLQNDMEVRKSIMSMAKAGSTQAHQLYLEMLRDLRLEDC